ncbi:glycosyltransferase [Chlorobaculum sp. 24CR]|uniref:glycosyltransferase family 4 protein n=1 Tax=Chlorobaculum sp. 24CR TaxID=2508878 RepID=UPI00100B5E15|nr:glycosyltransferase family 4 protein [Chlorobaculum sp. 24CR]RXK88450.1 glycosyltransferase [Chlorobaculum sp. 24CR]
MRILFIHQNFPGQFKHLAPALVARGHEVSAMTMRKDSPARWQGVRLVRYRVARGSTPGIHPWVADIESKTIRGEACFRACLKMKGEGFNPDVIVAHPGWGESLFVKQVWPNARLGSYCEFFYRPDGADIDFDPEFPVNDPEGNACRIRMKNLNNELHFGIADAGLSPTRWQASTFPEPFRQKITVTHDGIDTDLVRPDPSVTFPLHGGAALTRNDEVITFVNRNLEPYRGFHIFMRALPELLRQRPEARVLIVGGDEVSYGARPADGKSWKQRFSDEVRPRMSDEAWRRIHFLGKIPYPRFIQLLQLSTVHVYLTYPFVLSWSLLEAMSAGCAVVGSDTAPVREAILHDETGWLVDFFDASRLASQVAALLGDPEKRQALGQRASQFVRQHYDLKRACLPAQLEWVERLGAK